MHGTERGACVLALDLATKLTGWALWRDDESAPHYGSVPLAASSLGESVSLFERWLQSKLSIERVGALYLEAPVPMRGKTNLGALLKLYGLHATACKIAHDAGIPAHSVNLGTWRAFFLGSPRAPKLIAAAQRRAWLKRAAIEECARRGWFVASDDEADALGLLAYVRSVSVLPATKEARVCQLPKSVPRKKPRSSRSRNPAAPAPTRSPIRSGSRQAA